MWRYIVYDEEMKRIVFGLGNPGKEYERTRHNLGARVVMGWETQASDEVKAYIKIVSPLLPMNESGTVLKDVLRFVDIETQNILIVHDDIELPMGEVELVLGGSAKGHNGVRSIYSVLGASDFHRLRLGIGRPLEGMEVRDFVLGRFSVEEQSILDKMQDGAYAIINSFVAGN